MRISPVNIYNYRQSFTSTQKPNNTQKTNSPTELEIQENAQQALLAINELKQEAQKNYQDAKRYLEKSKIYYQKIEKLSADPTGLKTAAENTIFVPKNIDKNTKVISQFNIKGTLLNQTLFTSKNEIVLLSPSIYGADYFDRIYINKDKNYAVVNLGRKEGVDFEENKEVYEFQGNQLKRYVIGSSLNGIMNSSEAKNYRYHNNELISASQGAKKTANYITARSTFAFQNGELVIGRKNFINNGNIATDEGSYYKNELGEEIYEKDNYVITFKDGKMINFIEK